MTLSPVVRQWLDDQAAAQRQLVLVLNGLAEPPALARLFAAAPLKDYRNVFQNTEFDALSSHGHWLAAVEAGHQGVLQALLAAPQQPWGWLASAAPLDIDALAAHWRQRMLFHQHGQRWLYRFEDSRVMASHLSALTDTQRPLLLGPLHSALCWNGDAWQCFDNPRPGHYEPRQGSPWLDLPEPTEQDTLTFWEKWLWEHHPHAAAGVLEGQPLAQWLGEQWALAERWQWHSIEQRALLLTHRLNPVCAAHPGWQPTAHETPQAHFQRCSQQVTQWALPSGDA